MPWTRYTRRLCFGLSLASVLAITGADSVQIPLATEHDTRLGAVASEDFRCSQIGTRLLEDGGNAADALVGTVLCVGVTGMYHSGIGGGGFLLVRGSNGSYEYIDFRETAPLAATEDMYEHDTTGSRFGGLSVGTPGDIRGLEYLHKNYGRLSWKDVMAPAIRLARDGFTISHDLFRYMQHTTEENDFLTQDPAWAVDFAPNGTLLGLNDTITRHRYADTLEAIAEGGADVFYHGPMADATIRTVAAHGGILTLDDMAAYKVESRPPVAIDYRGYRVVGCAAPASGAVTLSALKVVEGYEDFGDREAVNISTHRLDEAIRFAYGERGSLGDPDFVPGVTDHEAAMLSARVAELKREKISDAHTLNVSDYNPDGYEVRDHHGTSHIVAADASGMAISLTTTINLIFGSQIIVPETGIIMNDVMDDFSIPHRKNAFGYVPSPSNYIRGRKRPMSSMTPVIVEHRVNHTLFYVVGAAGGSRIPTTTIQNLWHVLDQGMNVSAGLAMPRFHDQLLPNIIGFEWSSDNTTLPDRPGVPGIPDDDGDDDKTETLLWSYDGIGVREKGREESGIGTGFVHGYSNETVAFMRSRGHVVSWIPPGYSSAQAVRLTANGTFEAAGEPRQADSGGYAV